MNNFLKDNFKPETYFFLLKLGEITINGKNYYFKNLYVNYSPNNISVHYNGATKKIISLNDINFTGFFTITDNAFDLFWECVKYMEIDLKITRLRARTNKHIYLFDNIIECSPQGNSSTSKLTFYFRSCYCHKIPSQIGENFKADLINQGLWYKPTDDFF